MSEIAFTHAKLEEFEAAIKKHKAENDSGNETFMFDGHPFMVAYAEYLVEYLKSKFGAQP